MRQSRAVISPSGFCAQCRPVWVASGAAVSLPFPRRSWRALRDVMGVWPARVSSASCQPKENLPRGRACAGEFVFVTGVSASAFVAVAVGAGVGVVSRTATVSLASAARSSLLRKRALPLPLDPVLPLPTVPLLHLPSSSFTLTGLAIVCAGSLPQRPRLPPTAAPPPLVPAGRFSTIGVCAPAAG